jgi:hypothetical protein
MSRKLSVFKYHHRRSHSKPLTDAKCLVKRLKRFCAILGALQILSISGSVQAQGFDEPVQDSPGIDWRQIKSAHFKVVFPSDIQKDAQRVANTLERIYTADSKDLGVSPKKWPVVLHTNNPIANGSTDLRPHRMNFYSTQPQQFAGTWGYSSDWYQDLCIHEFRHAVQQTAIDRGLDHVGYLLFGDEAKELMQWFNCPDWYLEGDAVGMETALTKGGRGRTPSFDVELRAQTLSGRHDSYFKTIYGSYKDYIPQGSSYIYGYYLTTYVKRVYGADAWEKIIAKAYGWSIIPDGFSRAMKKVTGKNAKNIYKSAMAELETLWKNQQAGLQMTDVQTIAGQDSSSWNSYLYPQQVKDNTIIALNYGIDKTHRLVQIDPQSGKVKNLVGTGNIEGFSAVGSRVVWVEAVGDPRFGHKMHSVLRMYDLQTRKLRRITKRPALFAPTLSSDMLSIAAIEQNGSNEKSLVVLDALNGKQKARFVAGETQAYNNPCWSIDGKQIFCGMMERDSGLCIVSIDAQSGLRTQLTAFGKLNPFNPSTDGNFLYFVSAYSGIDNIYALDLQTKAVKQVSCRPFGAYNPSIAADGKGLVFSDVRSGGHRIVKAPIDSSAWTPLDQVKDRSTRYYEPLIAQTGGAAVLDSIDTTTYKVTKYGGPFPQVNVHSWTPTVDLNRTIGLTLKSTNLQGTIQASAGYFFNILEKTQYGTGLISYAGLYPIIDMKGSYGGRSVMELDSSNKEIGMQSWRESDCGFGMRLPLDLSRGNFKTGITLGAHADYIKVSKMDHSIDSIPGNGTFMPMSYDLEFTNTTNGMRDLVNPVWGQLLSVTGKHTPFKGDYTGWFASADAILFFPGLLKHQSFWVEGAYEQQNSPNYRFMQFNTGARGYDDVNFDKLAKGSVNYTVPLLYFDLNLIHILQFKALQTNIFYDYAQVYRNDIKQTQQSVGADLTVCTSFLSFKKFNLNVGVQESYLLDTKKLVTGLALKVGIPSLL